MISEKEMNYEKAQAEVVKFENTDVITTSGCATWSNQNGVACYYELTV